MLCSRHLVLSRLLDASQAAVTSAWLQQLQTLLLYRTSNAHHQHAGSHTAVTTRAVIINHFTSRPTSDRPANDRITLSSLAAMLHATDLPLIHDDAKRKTPRLSRRCREMQYPVMSPVCPSVTLVDQDHIRWKSWKLIARTISPPPSLFVV